MTLRPPVVPAPAPPARRSARRSTRIKRASGGLSRVRAGAGLTALLSAAAIYGLAASPAFGVDEVELGDTSFTDVCLRIVELAIERHAARPSARLGSGDLPR